MTTSLRGALWRPSGMQSLHRKEKHMNYGQIAKKIAYDRGFMQDPTSEDGEKYAERAFAPGKLDKLLAAWEKLKDITERRWKLVEAPAKKKGKKKSRR